METIVITNFSGRLTRLLNGEMNSGFAKFTPSFGYDPFSKPMNLTWLEQPSSIATTAIADMVVAGKQRYEGGVQYAYLVGDSGKVYKIQPNSFTNPNVDSVVGIASITAGSPSFNYGSSIEFFGATEKMYVASDNRINSLNFDGSGDAAIGNSAQFTNAGGHVLRKFIGKLMFGNGNTIGAIDSTGTVTSSVIGTGQGSLYSELNPPLPVSNIVHDVDASPDGNYLLMTASDITNEPIGVAGNDDVAGAASEGYLYRWNGTDETITSFNMIPSYAVTALQTYLNNNVFFSNDSFGASLNDGVSKILTLPGNKSPYPNSTLVNGNFISWIAPEIIGNNSSVVGSMYYFGSLDAENPPGLFRVLRYGTSLANGFVYQTPLNMLTNNKYSALNGSRSSVVTVALGKHYLSTWETSAGTAERFRLLRFLITPTGTGVPQAGVYETQTQLFSKRIKVKQIRVYTEPTTANNGFQLDMVGADGAVISNGTFTYSFVAGSDITKMEGALERIDFNPKANTSFSLGLRITNTGSVNMTIKKIEVDFDQEGR